MFNANHIPVPNLAELGGGIVVYHDMSGIFKVGKIEDGQEARKRQRTLSDGEQ